MKSRSNDVPRRSLLLAAAAAIPFASQMGAQIKLPNPLGKKKPDEKPAGEKESLAQAVEFLSWKSDDAQSADMRTGAAFSYRMADATVNTANGITSTEVRDARGVVILSIEKNQIGGGSYKLVDNAGKPTIQEFSRSANVSTLDEKGNMIPGARSDLTNTVPMLRMNAEDTAALLPELETPLARGHIIDSLPPVPAKDEPEKEETAKKGGFLRRRLDDAKNLKDKASEGVSKKLGKDTAPTIRTIPRHSFAGR